MNKNMLKRIKSDKVEIKSGRIWNTKIKKKNHKNGTILIK